MIKSHKSSRIDQLLNLSNNLFLLNQTFSKFNSKIIVASSSSFIINGYQSQSNNFNIFLNMLSWIVDDEGIMSITRPGLTSDRVIISMSQETLILFFLMICSPTTFFAIGIFMYRRRLNK